MTEMSREYAFALFMLAKENGAEEEYMKALSDVCRILSQTPEYIDFLSSPAVALGERIKMLEQAFSAFVPEHIVSFMSLLLEKGRIREFYGCVNEYKALLEFSKNVTVAKIKSAVLLTETEKERLKEKLSKMCGKSVMTECIVDETLKGGLLIELDGKTIDFSLKNRLHEVKDVISK